MNEFWEIVKFVLPALLCMGTAWVIFNALNKREQNSAKQALRLQAFSTIMPLRVSAYERAVLFLHRINPDNLLLRMDPTHKSARVFKQQLLDEIRNEYDHNSVQQLYISDVAWNRLVFARDHVAGLIQTASEGLNEKSLGMDLAKNVITAIAETTDRPVDEAIQFLKKDISKLFG